MIRSVFTIMVFLGCLQVQSQELNALVIVNSEQIQGTNKQVFNTLQTAVSEYLNNTKWTDQNYKPHERINCAITLNILEQPSTNEFKGNIQVQASRPVYNSTYQTPTLNLMDGNLSFSYTEFEPLIYNRNSFESNLVSILTFYAYTIIGIDADTFSLMGGDTYHKEAEKVVGLAQQGGYAGWNRIDGNRTRYQLNENLLASSYQDFREILYTYHRKGLDEMHANKKQAKNTISDALLKLNNLYNFRSNAFLLRVFMDTKADEIEDIFSDGPRVNAANLKETLLKIYPTYSEKWEKIKI